MISYFGFVSIVARKYRIKLLVKVLTDVTSSVFIKMGVTVVCTAINCVSKQRSRKTTIYSLNGW